jgi:hypothetical protein
MSNDKQSSVEWLFEELFNSFEKFNNGEFSFAEYMAHNLKLRQQAKEKHKEEIVNTWSEATSLDYEIGLLDASYILAQVHNAEQYYKEVFGGNND